MKKGTLAIVSTMFGAMVGAIGIEFFNLKIVSKKDEKVNKFKDYYNLLNRWLIVKHEGKSLEQYFIDNGYKTIAIYGMGELGNRLYEELKNTNITIKYAIDKEAGSTYSELEIINIEDELEKVDVVIVSAIFAYEKIEKELQQLIDYPIISLEDVIYEL